ncbi:MAG: SDR family NAD(P)-dependent oxidoreductase [Nocardioidaceae bacterium]
MSPAAPSAFPINVLVTGASSGIGQATAHYFAHRGARTLGTSRSHRGRPLHP